MWQRVIDFLQLRSFFTVWSLRIFWWMYILVEINRLYERGGTLRLLEKLPTLYRIYNVVDLFLAPVSVCVSIVTVRLLLEVVVPLIWPSLWAEGFSRSQHSLGQELIALLDIGRFFTPPRLRLFWLVFLLTLVETLCGYVIFNFPAEGVRSQMAVWLSFAFGFLGPLSYAAGVRLLVEAALLSAAPRNDVGSAAVTA